MLLCAAIFRVTGSDIRYLCSFRKCKAQFDKYCGPLLNLAGLKVGIIRTEKEGQAKELMEIMDNTDAVVIAGGDGTVAEVSRRTWRVRPINSRFRRVLGRSQQPGCLNI